MLGNKDVETIYCLQINIVSTYFTPIFRFYAPWKRQKTKGFLTISGGIEMEH